MSDTVLTAETQGTGLAVVGAAPPESDGAAGNPEPWSSDTVEARPARLLLICSDPKLASELALSAQVVGFDCDICERHQALPFLGSNVYDAALLDLIAPESDFPLIEEARSAAKSRQIPIVALAEHGDVNAAFRAGASFALARPVGPDLLKNTLAAIYRIAVGQRRQYARYRVEIPLALNVEGQALEGKATDLGHGGLALVTAEPLKSGAILSVRFVLPGSQEQIIAVGEVRWSDHCGRSGLCFNSIAGVGRQALDNWMARRHAGITDPVPRVTKPPAPPVADVGPAAGPAQHTSRLALTVILASFCLFVVGFWIYIAVTS